MPQPPHAARATLLRRLLGNLLSLQVAWSIGSPAWADVGPENVAVVINGDSWASRSIANAFIHGRHVPPDNVIVLRSIPSFETISIDDFRERILGPVLQELDARGLSPQIDCIAYSADLPWAVNARDDFGATAPPFPTGSINGLTYLYPLVRAGNTAFMNLNVNAYARREKRPHDDAPWTDAHRAAYARAVELLQQGDRARAEPLLREVTEAHPHFDQALYNHACCLALLGRAEEAMARLARAVECGWSDAAHTRTDEDLASLREREDFQALMKRLEEPRVHDIEPTLGFDAARGFTREGDVAPRGEGMHYLLAAMLACTSGRGLSVREAIDSLARSIHADSTHPQGTFYFTLTRDVRSTTRRPAFDAAMAMLREMGHRAEMIESELPEGRNDIAGLMAGTADFNWAAAKSTILPGAICEHLTSFGGVMRANAGQTPLVEFLRAGAAGASGTVDEPFAIQAKFPLPYMHVHYARGATLIEAFYQSILGPYQLLIVGDPLCAPWAERPVVTVRGVRAGEQVRGTITLMPDVADPRPAPIEHFDVFIDGHLAAQLAPGESFTLDATTLDDGHHELRFVAACRTPLATQGRAIVPISVRNTTIKSAFKPRSREVRLDEKVTFDLAVQGAASVEVMHQGQVVGRIEGDRGTITFDALALGLGEAMLTARAQDEQGKNILVAGPERVEVVEPAIRPGRPQPPEGLEPGLLLRVQGDATRRIVGDTREPKWLREAGVEEGQSFTLEGWFHVEHANLAQLQIHSPHAVEVTIDGGDVAVPLLGEWRFVPLSLGAGWHVMHVRVNVGPRDSPRLDVRYGIAGTKWLDGERFGHLLE